MAGHSEVGTSAQLPPMWAITVTMTVMITSLWLKEHTAETTVRRKTMTRSHLARGRRICNPEDAMLMVKVTLLMGLMSLRREMMGRTCNGQTRRWRMAITVRGTAMVTMRGLTSLLRKAS